MHRIDTPSATPDNQFTEGSPAGGVPATLVSDAWLNDVQESICQVIERSGIELQKGEPEQLADAIAVLIASESVQGIGGAFADLRLGATGLNYLTTITARELLVKDAAGRLKVLSAVNLTANASTSGAGGLDTGALAASTWYAVWVIWNGANAAALLSLSDTAPTLPAGYTHKARVGWIRTDDTGNKYPLGFGQAGRTVRWGGLLGYLVSHTGTDVYTASVAWGTQAPPTAVELEVSVGAMPTTGFSYASVSLASAWSGQAGNDFRSIARFIPNGPTFVFTGYNSEAGGVARAGVYGWEDAL